MMKTTIDSLLNLFVAAVLLLSVAGCADDHLTATEEHAPLTGEIILKLTLSNGLGGETRATGDSEEEEDDPLRPGVSSSDGVNENAISNVYLFLEPKETTGDTPATRISICFRNFTLGTNEIRLPLETFEKAGYGSSDLTQYAAYVGVNLSDAQAEAFKNNNEEYTVTTESLLYGLTEEFAPGRGIGLDGLTGFSNAGYTRTNIAMFCTEKHNIIESNASGQENEKRYSFDGTFNLKRNVAKVLTTAVTDANAKDYCILKGNMLYPKDYENVDLRGKGRGWIRQADVMFMLNGLNKKSYIMQNLVYNQNIGDGVLEIHDPNYDGDKRLDTYIDESGGMVVPNEKYKDDFYYNQLEELDQYTDYYVKTLSYDASKIPVYNSNNNDKYYEGLYCPENTFTTEGISDHDYTILNEYNYPWPMITFVSITTKFTPRELYVEKSLLDYIDTDIELTDEQKTTIKKLIEKGRFILMYRSEIVVIDSPSEEITWAILNASLRKYDMIKEENGLPERTYFTITDTGVDPDSETGEYPMRFYTYGAARWVAKHIGGWKPEDAGQDPTQLLSFQAMPGGRGYYFTYIDNRSNKESDKNQGTFTFADAEVERNTYYILTINSFSSPGQTGNEPEYIKVHTRIADWVEGGKADVTLK